MGEGFPRTARLLKHADFQFPDRKRVYTDLFLFSYSEAGRGRLGASLPKKVLRPARARNRVRRLLRESFRKRKDRFAGIDLHAIARPDLGGCWESLTQRDLDHRLDFFVEQISKEQLRRKPCAPSSNGSPA